MAAVLRSWPVTPDTDLQGRWSAAMPRPAVPSRTVRPRSAGRYPSSCVRNVVAVGGARPSWPCFSGYAAPAYNLAYLLALLDGGTGAYCAILEVLPRPRRELLDC